MTAHPQDLEEGVPPAAPASSITGKSRLRSKVGPRKRRNKSACASCPTPTDTSQIDPSIDIRTILVPTDFSPLSVRALIYARRFAEHFGAQLILLNVMERLTYAPAYCPLESVKNLRATRRRAAEDSLAQLIADSEPPCHKVAPWRTIVAEGDSASETDRVARENEVDMIVIASHCFGGLSHLLLGSTTEKVVRHSPCPVLVVRENERDFISDPPSAASCPE